MQFPKNIWMYIMFFLIANLRYPPQKCWAVNMRIYSQRWPCSTLRITGCSVQTVLSCSHHIPIYIDGWLSVFYVFLFLLVIPCLTITLHGYPQIFTGRIHILYPREIIQTISMILGRFHTIDGWTLMWGGIKTILPLVKAKIAGKLMIMHMILW